LFFSAQLETDESYTLDIPASANGQISITAPTVYGAMHALETLSQLVTYDFDTEGYAVAAVPWSIADAPRFPHRGLMVDTARHFETLSAIRGMIDSLPYSKINVLHWHMSDSQSFPMESKTHPRLWKGAFSDQERYTQADIASVVEYARLRGVRVMVEFDMPGHAGSWCKGYPEVIRSPLATHFTSHLTAVAPLPHRSRTAPAPLPHRSRTGVPVRVLHAASERGEQRHLRPDHRPARRNDRREAQRQGRPPGSLPGKLRALGG
jgi:N-acetyl-beta-hexosaminidase